MEMKDIKGYEGLYSVTTTGQIYSYKSKKFLALSENNRGYFSVILYKNGTKANYSVHRLVAETFIPNPENKKTVDHIDRNRLNNNVENLRWATHQEQAENKDQELRKQHMKEIQKLAVEKTRKKTAMVDIETDEIIQVFDSCREAAAIGLGDVGKQSDISKVCLGKKKQAYGYSWKYVE